MKLNEIHEMIENDSKIDVTNLTIHSIEIPALSAKYNKILYSLIELSKKADLKLLSLKRELLEYYRGYSDDEIYKQKPLNRKPQSSEVDIYIKSDPEYQKIQRIADDINLKIKLIENFITQLNNRSFMIKNAIEWEKFKQGGY